jgi:predicted  nucleic acid-binding Zn-ribbon protein
MHVPEPSCLKVGHPMNDTLKTLLELEVVNREIARLSAEVAELPKKVATIEAKLAKTKAQVAAAQDAVKKEETARRGFESDIKDHNLKISKLRDQSLAVKTNEQYRAMMHEIEFEEKAIAGCEEKILLSLEAADKHTAELKAAEAQLKLETADVDKEKKHAQAVTAEDEKKLKELSKKRDTQRAKVEERTLAMYELIATKRVPAIVEALEQKCMACHVKLRPQTFNELLTTQEIMTCSSCARILYRDPTRAAEEVAAEVNKAALRVNHQAWYFLADSEWGKNLFVVTVESKTSATLHCFDAFTGKHNRKIVQKKMTVREAFGEKVMQGTHLHIGNVHPEEHTDGGLPEHALEELQLQAQIAPETASS